MDRVRRASGAEIQEKDGNSQNGIEKEREAATARVVVVRVREHRRENWAQGTKAAAGKVAGGCFARWKLNWLFFSRVAKRSHGRWP